MTYLYANNAAGTLAGPLTNVSASLTLNVGQAALFPNPVAPDTFFATLTDAATQTLIEIVSVTSVSGNTMTITRAQDGTSAQSWNTGDILSQRVIAAELRQWQGIVPVGGIIMWSGAATAIPENWALCNGTAGTPNLENTFVIGAGGTYPVGATGGSATALLDHVHSITDPGHVHGNAPHSHGYVDNLGNPAGIPTTNTVGGTIFEGTGTPNITFSTTTSAVSVPIALATTGIVGTNVAGTGTNSLPPYYALCYIMRVT